MRAGSEEKRTQPREFHESRCKFDRSFRVFSFSFSLSRIIIRAGNVMPRKTLGNALRKYMLLRSLNILKKNARKMCGLFFNSFDKEIKTKNKF